MPARSGLTVEELIEICSSEGYFGKTVTHLTNDLGFALQHLLTYILYIFVRRSPLSMLLMETEMLSICYLLFGSGWKMEKKGSGNTTIIPSPTNLDKSGKSQETLLFIYIHTHTHIHIYIIYI